MVISGMICSKMYDFVKMTFVLILLYLFIEWQAIPCTKKYLKKETMINVYQVGAVFKNTKVLFLLK